MIYHREMHYSNIKDRCNEKVSLHQIINMNYSTLAKFMKIFLLPTEMVLKTEN